LLTSVPPNIIRLYHPYPQGAPYAAVGPLPSPLSERRHWHSFHNSWATYLSSQLNSLLPEGYFAEANVQYGIEIDVAAFEEPGAVVPVAGWAPPLVSVPLDLPEAVVEVGIFSRSGGPILAGAIEWLARPIRTVLPPRLRCIKVRIVYQSG